MKNLVHSVLRKLQEVLTALAYVQASLAVTSLKHLHLFQLQLKLLLQLSDDLCLLNHPLCLRTGCSITKVTSCIRTTTEKQSNPTFLCFILQFFGQIDSYREIDTLVPEHLSIKVSGLHRRQELTNYTDDITSTASDLCCLCSLLPSSCVKWAKEKLLRVPLLQRLLLTPFSPSTHFDLVWLTWFPHAPSRLLC